MFTRHLYLESFGDAARLGEHVCVAHCGKITERNVELALSLKMCAWSCQEM